MPPKVRCYHCGRKLPLSIYRGPKKELRARLEKAGWSLGSVLKVFADVQLGGMTVTCPKCQGEGQDG